MNVADLTLRFGLTRVAGRLYWPTGADAEHALIVLLARDEGLGRGLCWASEAVVLALPVCNQLEALGWAVDHAAQLGARSDDLLIVGGADAALLAVSSHRAAWPPVRRQVLIHPVFSTANPMPAELSGLPPATVVAGEDDDGSAYAERLQEEGIEVEVLPGPALTALAGSLRSSDAH